MQTADVQGQDRASQAATWLSGRGAEEILAALSEQALNDVHDELKAKGLL